MSISDKRFWTSVLEILGVTLIVHLLFIPITPRESDENVYLNVTRQVLTIGYPHLDLHQFGEKDWFTFQPFLHFSVMSGWARTVGDLTIASLRVLSSFIAVGIVGAAMWFTWLVTKERIAVLAAGAFLCIAGWITYTTGLVKIDPAATLVGILGLCVFLIAARTHINPLLWVSAGLLLGIAAVYKHTGGYVLIAVALYWLFTGRHPLSENRRYVLTVQTAFVVIILYLVWMTATVQGTFLEATLIQIRRTLGLQQARGLNFGPAEFVDAIVSTYWAYSGSILTLLIGWGLAVRYGLKHLAGHDRWLAPLTAAVLAALGMLTLVRLQNPHYLVYAEWGCRVYLAVIACWQIVERRALWKIARTVVIAIVALDLLTLGIRAFVFSRSDAFAQIEESVANLPLDAVFLSEESVCAAIEQRCYSFDTTTADQLAADLPWYIITQDTKTLDPPTTATVQQILSVSVERKELFAKDWKGEFHVYQTPYHR